MGRVTTEAILDFFLIWKYVKIELLKAGGRLPEEYYLKRDFVEFLPVFELPVSSSVREM